MKNKRDTVYFCVSCSNPTTEIHEIFFGKNRKLSIIYNCQVPVCQACHSAAHGKGVNKITTQYEWVMIFCEFLDIDSDITLQALNSFDYLYLESIKEKCLDKIKSAEI